MPSRLTIEDPELFPVQCFFNAVSDSSSIQMMDCLTSGVGFSINEADVSFPSDLDSGEAPLDGIRFSLFEETVVISKLQLARFLKTVCHDYVSDYPVDEEKISLMLERMDRGS